MKILCIVGLFLCLCSQTLAQFPEHWQQPTILPGEGTDRVILYTTDSAQIALRAIAALLQAQGFQIAYQKQIGLSADYLTLANGSENRKLGAVTMTVVISQTVPGILTLSGSSITNTHSASRNANPRKRKSNSEACAFGKSGSKAAQAGFNLLVTTAKAYPNGRVMYLKTQ
ncbi:hypothetical protein H8B15_08400 [Hymenobacter sp. BT507]|uniref:Uncharacterized protein n=1 Tax=Hymenobacter citatus TaxID=2763506 RepID=A0ABR7MIP6_9BACT|nr:hypothetical protein [Hymenobacter citatus]MBC6610941.1 hypothetical protein [Hymenobacter citatus]